MEHTKDYLGENFAEIWDIERILTKVEWPILWYHKTSLLFIELGIDCAGRIGKVQWLVRQESKKK